MTSETNTSTPREQYRESVMSIFRLQCQWEKDNGELVVPSPSLCAWTAAQLLANPHRG